VAMMAGPSSSGIGGVDPHPTSMCVALFIGLCHSRFSCFYSDSEWRCFGDRSRTSSIPVIRRPVARLVTSLPPLVASSTVSVGDLDVVPLGLPWSVVVLWNP
jgi:hypothetical protein